MYVTDVPVIDRLTDSELEEREHRRHVAQDVNLDVHLWALSHTR